jgi:hypothetical protein
MNDPVELAARTLDQAHRLAAHSPADRTGEG